MCIIHCPVLSGLLLLSSATENTELITQHSSQLTQKQPPLARGEWSYWATEKQRVIFQSVQLHRAVAYSRSLP